MPRLARRLSIWAGTDGLSILQHNNKEDEGLIVQISYGTSKISATSKGNDDESEVSSIEAFGIVGILDLVSISHLILITQREQVAQVFGKSIYVVKDVALVPLASQADAEKAIVAAKKVSKYDEKFAAEKADLSDIEDEEEEPLPQEGTEQPPVQDQNATQSRARYGSLARRWLSKGARGIVGRRRQASDSGKAPEVAEEPNVTEVESGKDNTEQAVSQENNSSQSNRPGEDSNNDKQAANQNVEILAPRILRTAKLLFATSGFYFSYDHDISGTLTQTSDHTAAVPLWKRFDEMFFWNRHLINPFVEVGQHDFVLPLMQGFVGQRLFSISRADDEDGHKVIEASQDPTDVLKPSATDSTTPESDRSGDFLLTLISRRSVRRAGLRYTRRGVDDDGNVANYVETEQILSSQNWNASEKAFSLVQVRGSIPLHFSQSPYSFKPTPIMFGSELTNQSAFKKHFDLLSRRYGDVQIVSLVDKHGPEVSIGQSFENNAEHLIHSGGVNGKDIRFEWFDFHGNCKGMKFENVSILIDSLSGTMQRFGWVEKQQGRNVRLQAGVVRSNCMDCLDRSNVVQSSIASWALEKQLSELGFSIDLRNDPKTQWFNTIWADNGDAISKQYAGTAALKGDFTRTRKRNWTGALADFGKTLNRYYNNIFGDYFLQTCIDYFLGKSGPGIFDEFETEMMSKDYALDMRRIRQNGINTCVQVVLEDPTEELAGGWILSCPRESNTIRTLPFEDCVVLLTSQALYICRFDWDMEKVKNFDRVELVDIEKIWRGAYVTSALGPTNLDELKNVGFAIQYTTGGNSITRTNTATYRSEEEPDDAKKEQKDAAQPKDEESRLWAFKALPPIASAAKDDIEEIAAMSEIDLVKHISDVLHRLTKAAYAGRSSSASSAPAVEEKDVISVTDAQKQTGYMESIGYSLKRLVWS